jgi:hypothetical protein
MITWSGQNVIKPAVPFTFSGIPKLFWLWDELKVII